MLLVIAPIVFMIGASILGMLGHALGLLPPSQEWFSPRVASGIMGTVMVWFVTTFVRHMLRSSEQDAAERAAREALLREQNVELWMARQLHDTAVTERTAAILATVRQRPLYVRLRTLIW
jgi:hypothetical protein